MNKRIRNKVEKREMEKALLSFHNYHELKMFINREQASLIER